MNVLHAGRMAYRNALELQETALAARAKGEVPDTLILVEHPPVVTLGRRGDRANILAGEAELAARGIEVVEVNRGGDVTYHGLGQLVGYPIFDLRQRAGDARGFVSDIAETFIRLLSREFGIEGRREEGKHTGVWVGNDKLVAIGIAVRGLVTMHGFAFNVNIDPDEFRVIRPCGLADRGVTSLARILGREVDFEATKAVVEGYFAEAFK
jgi:lipoyl(octanoyl) transferase